MNNQNLPRELFDKFSEDAAIGAALSSEELALEIISLTEHKDYSGENFRIIKAIEDLKSENQDISFISVRGKLETLGWLENVGSEAGLRRLSLNFTIDDVGKIRLLNDKNMIFSSIKTVCERIKEKSNLRRLLENIEDTADKIRELKLTSSDSCSALRDAIINTDTTTEHAAKSAEDMLPSIIDHIHTLRVGGIVADPTGFEGFDKHTGGTRGGDVVLIIGLSKGGKSALALNIIDNYSQRGIISAFFSLEMPLIEVENRRLCRRLNTSDWSYTEYEGKNITLNRIQGGYDIKISENEANQMLITADTISKSPIYLIPPSVRDVRKILLESERLITQKGVTKLFYDYAQLCTGNSGSEHQNISYLMQEIKSLCNVHADKRVSAFVMSQVDKEGQKVARALHKISADDAHGSGELLKTATIITTIWLEDEKFKCGCPEDDQNEKKQDVRIGKQMVQNITRKHEFSPTNGLCEDCHQKIQEIPIRSGGWYIERARATAGSRVVPLEYEGRYMNFTEIL